MQIVIDIPENIYQAIMDSQIVMTGQRSGKTLLGVLVSGIYKGTPIPKGQWIPCSERLPKDSGNYLIAISDRNFENGQYYKISWFYPSNKKWSYRNATVIAWMPLPEPYKTESEDKK